MVTTASIGSGKKVNVGKSFANGMAALQTIEKEKFVIVDDGGTNKDAERLSLFKLKDTDKTIVIDSAQYRNIKDYSILKGEIIVIRTSIDNCYKRVLDRWKSINKNYNQEEYVKYAERKKGMFKWYKSINKFIETVEKYNNFQK